MSRPRVLAFRHVPFEHLGLIAEALERQGIACDYADLHEDPRRSFDIPDGLILMGGPMSANDDLEYLRREMQAIESAVAAGKPVLGVCLGSQLIAKAMGGRVYRNAVKEIGWYPVYWTDAAQSDRLFRGLENSEPVFHWHGETFDLPRGAEWLAWSDACKHQAFRIGSNIYGLQFHLEVTPEMIADWCTQDANCGDMREISEPIDPAANAGRMRELSASVFGRWCELMRG